MICKYLIHLRCFILYANWLSLNVLKVIGQRRIENGSFLMTYPLFKFSVLAHESPIGLIETLQFGVVVEILGLGHCDVWGWNSIIQEESKATICFEEFVGLYCWLYCR